jgi:hypothetical protein
METQRYNRIKEVLDEKNKDVYWLQTQLEGETIPCVVRWCKNVKQPTIEQLFEIARVLEIDVRELIVSTNSQLPPIIVPQILKSNISRKMVSIP